MNIRVLIWPHGVWTDVNEQVRYDVLIDDADGVSINHPEVIRAVAAALYTSSIPLGGVSQRVPGGDDKFELHDVLTIDRHGTVVASGGRLYRQIHELVIATNPAYKVTHPPYTPL